MSKYSELYYELKYQEKKYLYDFRYSKYLSKKSFADGWLNGFYSDVNGSWEKENFEYNKSRYKERRDKKIPLNSSDYFSSGYIWGFKSKCALEKEKNK